MKPQDAGAHFYRCDFEVHTPRDINWKGDRPKTEEEREAYAREFVQACRTKGLNAVAITDHHDVVFYKYIRDAAANETGPDGDPVPNRERLVVFPGMELTLGVPCQALLIFDANLPFDVLNEVLVILNIQPNGDDDSTTAEVSRLDHIHTIEQLYGELEKREYLQGKFTVLPNVTDGGHGTIMRREFAAKYKNIPCVGGYINGSIEKKVGEGNQRKLSGNDTSWGNKKLALFQVSDSRSRDFAQLGMHTTWVKWAEPSAEAIRQACLAERSRISQTEPHLPNAVITRLEVSNSRFMSRINLFFNPQYNALIGGRGTGKSTILEYLRWGLCDQPPTPDDDGELPDFQKKRKGLIAGTLSEYKATVTVHLSLNDVPHVVRRKTDTNEIALKIGDGEFQPCTEKEIRSLLPIQAYSQKQLSNIGVKLDELRRFVNAPIKQELAGNRSDLQKTSLEIRDLYGKINTKRTLERETQRYTSERDSIRKQIQELRKQVTGLSEEDQKAIELFGQLESEHHLVEQWSSEREQASSLLDEFQEATADMPSLFDEIGDLPNSTILTQLQEDMEAAFTAMRTGVTAAASAFAKTASGGQPARFEQLTKEWSAAYKKGKDDYEAAKKRSAAHEATLAEIRKLEKRAKQLDKLIATKTKDLKQIGDVSEKYNQLRKTWKQLHEERAQALEKASEKLSALSNGFIRATIRRGAETSEAEANLKDAFRGSKVRSDKKVEKLIDSVVRAQNPASEWMGIIDELEMLAILDPDENIVPKLPSTPSLESFGFTPKDRTALARQLSTADCLDLWLTELHDLPVFEYKARDDDYIPFTDASAGQQATALMHVLLNQGGPPIVIDQPEDDLDNQVINDIVEDIWKSKNQRQLIFSSHNANLVVNGDAELVVCCAYEVSGEESAGEIRHVGAIDVQTVRDEITSVMEGGKQAFSLRKEKYGF